MSDIIVTRHENSVFKSNSYLLELQDSLSFWVVDPGDSDWIQERFAGKSSNLIGILVTHTHFDHIYGINALIKDYPGAKIICSEFAIEGLLSSKINRSYYTANPFVVNSSNITPVKDQDSTVLWDVEHALAHSTPGHDRDCLSYEVGNYYFTGDSYIPGVKFKAYSKYADAQVAKYSVKEILRRCSANTLICPGHGAPITIGEVSS